MIEEEAWLPCPGFETHYEVSDHGRIRRTQPERCTTPGRIRKFSLNANGYYWVSLCVGGVQSNRAVHRLVCEAFNGAPPAGKNQAAHRDGNKLNNRAGNLYWADQVENMADRARHGDAPRGSRSGMAKLSEADIPAIRAMRERGMTQRDIGVAFGVVPHTISRILAGKRWAHAAR